MGNKIARFRERSSETRDGLDLALSLSLSLPPRVYLSRTPKVRRIRELPLVVAIAISLARKNKVGGGGGEKEQSKLLLTFREMRSRVILLPSHTADDSSEAARSIVSFSIPLLR